MFGTCPVLRSGLAGPVTIGACAYLSDNARLFLEPSMSDPTESLAVDAVLDATGLNCPEPVMMLHQKVRDLPAGGLLKVIATDPSTQRDIPKFCVFLDHELVDKQAVDGVYLYWIRKKQA
jgi:tRNA 2-thiouridine synthesizing protein A